MIISKTKDKIEKDLEGRTLFFLRAELDHPDKENSESYLVLYKDNLGDIVILKESESPKILEDIKNIVKKYNSPIETERKSQIPRFIASSKGTIYSFAKQVKNSNQA